MNDGSAVRRQILDPNPLISEAASLAMTGADDRIVPRLALAEAILVSVDPIQIQQVFINLIRNAAEAVEGLPGGEIKVSSRIRDGLAEILVDDSGPGIAPDMMGRLFDSFVSSKPGGMGVGLSISRTIVEAHGGKLTLEKREAGGASFCVALPLADGQQPPSS